MPKEAMKPAKPRSLNTRLILAALKDRDIAKRTEDADEGA